MPEHILFLTTANLATNPRLVKEIRLALMNSIEVTVVMFLLGNWSDAKSRELAVELNSLGDLKIINLNSTKSNKFKWLLWGGLEKISQKIYGLTKKDLSLNALASSRRSLQLLRQALKLTDLPNLICAHNLGALYPAYVLSKKWKIPFVFDVEDFHPGEFISVDAKNEKTRREYLMQRLLPKAEAITSASPLIDKFTMELIGGHKNHKVILNGFSQEEFKMPEEKSGDIDSIRTCKLVWFSQKIAAGRGLENLFKAFTELEKTKVNRSYELTLIGDMDETFKRETIIPFLRSLSWERIKLNITGPIAQKELHGKLSQYDVGLALEPGKDLNNELAISNKILAYAQAGLFILGTNTKAQNIFLSKHPSLGLICAQSKEDLRESMEKIFDKLISIRENAGERYKQAKFLSWEREAEKLQEVWKID